MPVVGKQQGGGPLYEGGRRGEGEEGREEVSQKPFVLAEQRML